MGGSTSVYSHSTAARMRRGTVVWVNLEDAHPPEMGKTRAAVLVSNAQQNEVLTSVVIVPLSSRAPAIWPLRVEVPATETLQRSYAVVPGIRQVAKTRLLHAEGVLPALVLERLSEAVAAYLSD